ncbi:E3 ubiquitin/ISG15 ligase TRIM25-like [Hoplias malabaricus]|uniref:E3 ubiquitin/ISG15 ligase TRIM25-like n=1 Tax=Hoplias malabaricus TaxID=27720 RepID=UPI003462DB6C
MAQAGVFLEHDQFNCSICLDVLKDPVTVPCGHSYCKGCIKGYWDQDEYLGIYGCPQCRQSFAPRPVLGRNTMLADVVEKLKKTSLCGGSSVSAAPPPSQSEPECTEPGDVPCDVCRKNKAYRSCLVCLASFCETHLKPHYESPAFQKHKLVTPSVKLQESLCPRHDKLLEVFCRTDQYCICYLCLTDEHKGHDTVLASVEITDKKNALAEMQRNSQQRIQEREKELQDLRQATQSLTLSAQAAVDECERIFTELVCSIERRRTEVKELIQAQEREATGQAEELLRQLEHEIRELKKRDAELGQLVQAEDHISFLQNYRSVCTPPVSVDVPSITVDPGFGCVMSAVSEFQALLDDVCQGGFVNISEKVSDVTIVQNVKPKADTEPNTALPSVPPVTFPVSPVFQSFGVQNAFGVTSPAFTGFTFTSFSSRPPGARLRTQQRRRRRVKMAAAATISVDEEQFCCSVCLEILRDPVTIPCGHSYCMDCIKGYWKKTEHKSGYCCPQCRRGFSPRPVLARNTMLAELVEKLRQAGLKVEHTGPGKVAEVDCDLCPGRKRKAVKSCMKCLASYCESHLKQHNERDRSKTHRLTDATRQLQKRVCPQHCRLFEFYCRTDQQLICCLCTTDGHSGHHTVTVLEERTEKQRQLEEAFRRAKLRGKEKEKEIRNIMKYLKRSGQAVEEDSEKIFIKIKRSVERRHCEVKELVRAEEREALAQAEGLLESLEQQIEDQRRRENELEQLSHSDDHIHFLQKSRVLCAPAELEEPPYVDVHPYFTLLILRRALTELRERINDMCDRELSKISDLIKDEHSESDETLSSPTQTEIAPPAKSVDQSRGEPNTRANFLQYCCDVTLDPNTANSQLCLSEGNKKVSMGYESQQYPEHPDRFSSWPQVLGKDGFSERSYWEVEWAGNSGIAIGVSYKGIIRHSGSTDGKLGCNSKSWSLDLSGGLCTFQHNKSKTEIPTPISPRIGVYLDHKGGILAFYCVSPRGDSMTLLHKVQTTFSQPLYPGFWVGAGSTLKLCPILNFSA